MPFYRCDDGLAAVNDEIHFHIAGYGFMPVGKRGHRHATAQWRCGSVAFDPNPAFIICKSGHSST
jgi:hypothetical protein